MIANAQKGKINISNTSRLLSFNYIIRRLQPRNSESNWVVVLYEIQDGVHFNAFKSI